MAPGRPSSARRTAVASSSISARMRITKSGSGSDSSKDKVRSSPRSTKRVRPKYRESSGSELSSEEDEEEVEEVTDDGDDEEEATEGYKSARPSKTGNRRSLRTAEASRRSSTNARASRAAARDKRATGIDLKKVATGRVSGKSGRKRGRPPISIRRAPEDDVSDEDEDGEEGDEDEDDSEDSKDDLTTKKSPSKSPVVKRRRGRPPKKAGRGARKISTAPDTPKPEVSSIIPNWLDPRMQHAIWVQVFRFAALGGDEDEEGQDVNWLLQTARVCRDFADPALTVLYRCPPVTTETKAYGLAELLEKPPSMTAVNYRAKIMSLHIDVRLVSLQNHTPAIKLMQNLPRLSEVLLSHGYDQAPYRLLVKPIKWTYPPDLWQALQPSPNANAEVGDKTSITRLQSWQWSSRLMDKDWEGSLANMKAKHQLPSFATLRKLRLVNYQLPSVRLEKDDPETLAEDEKSVKAIADALSALNNLEQLVFESSTIICTALFPLLTTKLKRLELVNCNEVTADNLGSFLISNGQQLEALVLNHNRSLSLAFLAILGTACPHLKELRANFRYFSLLETVDDNEPQYDHLLLPDQVPNWPSALETLHLENLRKWDMETAEMFLQSFIDSAPILPMLRYLSVKAMLDIPWRQRSTFRKSWQEKLDTVFLRQVDDPEQNFTLREKPDSAEAATTKRKRRKAPGEPTRRSNRVVSHGSGRSSRASSTSKGLRDQMRKPKTYREPDSDEFDSEEEDDVNIDQTADDSEDDTPHKDSKEADDASTSDGAFIQGLCTVVDINIDNQKLREHQYSMDDFLNVEGDFESDDEWNGDVDLD
ncbi:hypothetical protein CkaCkLH20_04036 [Colletotrichum karsti]|uniref:Uncharacterized protein n=1 Tax=Colletotrichum karsti TaxID=1095194 RepID=A0A9P6I9P5_9PEZI|nr:uncharacterized protein CkaCkLH20_04036 [Colletotrichum karsti]KAF9878544.1 hypothetical protein CkaCkLH20_04036 [Colletotrichum karsti]